MKTIIAFVGVNAFFVAIHLVFAGMLYALFLLSKTIAPQITEDLMAILAFAALGVAIWFMLWSMGLIEKLQRRG